MGFRVVAGIEFLGLATSVSLDVSTAVVVTALILASCFAAKSGSSCHPNRYTKFLIFQPILEDVLGEGFIYLRERKRELS